MSWFVVDVEADGPYPGSDGYSMVSLGIIKVDRQLESSLYIQTSPISSNYENRIYKLLDMDREEHMSYPHPAEGMRRLVEFIYEHNKSGRPVMWSDNNAFDWQFVNFYLHYFTGENPFGYSSRRIGDVYSGLVCDPYSKWKCLRKTKHTHHPVDDAKGNAEVLLHLHDAYGYKVSGV